VAEGEHINPNLKGEWCEFWHNQADSERPETGERYFEGDHGGIKGNDDPKTPDWFDMTVTQS